MCYLRAVLCQILRTLPQVFNKLLQCARILCPKTNYRNSHGVEPPAWNGSGQSCEVSSVNRLVSHIGVKVWTLFHLRISEWIAREPAPQFGVVSPEVSERKIGL